MAGYNEDVNINLNILAGAMGGITAIASGMSALTSTFGQFGTTAVDTFGDVSGLLVTTTALIGAFGLEAASAAGEFEQNMKIVQAVSGQTGGAIAELGEQANQLSVQYRTAIGDITEGLQTLGRAGLNSADTQLEVLESGLQTAKLEGRNLNGVLEELIQNTAMLGGNLDSLDFGAQTEYVNSLMVGTSMSAPIDTHDISQTLQYVGGTAAAAGANLEDKEKLEDLMGTIAAFAQKGVTGSMAGTALRAFLTKPASQDKSVVEGLGAIGLSPEDLWENGGESMKDISDQIELIQRQMDRLHLSTMDQLEIWGKIVGPKMGQQMMKLEADKIDSLTEDIQSAASAEELATSTLYTYNQRVSEMGEIGSGVFRQLGANIVMWLNPVLEVINKILSLFNNQYGGLFLFGTAVAIVSRGLQAAYGMITSIVGQLRAAFSEVTTALSNIGGNQEGIISGATRYDSIVKQAAADIQVMNSNLMETDTLWGKFQAAALGKQATQQMRGYSSDNPMDKGLLGVSDDYRQYFRNKDTVYNYEAYGFKNSMFKGISQDVYDTLPASSKRMFEKIADGAGEAVTYRIKKDVISVGEFEKLPPEMRKFYDRQEISHEQYNELNKTQQKKYSRTGDGIITNIDEIYDHKHPGQYQSLSSEDKKKYGSKEFRIEDRVGTIEEMERQIKESSSKLQIVSKEEWEKASEAERRAIERATAKFREDMENQARRSKEIITTTGPDGKEYDTGMRYYQTYSNIPKAEDLAELTKRDNKNWAKKMVEAQGMEDFSTARQSARSRMSRRDQVRFDGLENLRKSADRTGSIFNRVGSAISGSGQRLNAEGKLVQSRFQQLRNSIGNGISSLSRLTNGFALSSSRITELETSMLGLIAEEGKEVVTSTTLNGKFSEMAAKLGITEQEFAELVLASQQVENAFQRISGATPDEIGDIAGKKIGGKFGKLSGALSSVVGIMGGPFPAALMGVTLVIQAVQGAFQNYQQELQEAQKELSEARQQREEIEQSIKDIYTSENGNLTEADLNRALENQYGSIGEYQTGNSLDDYGRPYIEGDVYYTVDQGEDPTSRIGDENYIEEFELANTDNIKALNENTVQLAAATAAYSKAAGKVEEKFLDPIWGSFNDQNTGNSHLDNAAISTALSDIELFNSGQKNLFHGGGPHLLASQKANDYAGSKELAGLIAADAQRFGPEAGLEKVFDTNIGDIREKLGGIESNTYKSMVGLAQNAVMNPEQAAAAQVSLKENKDSYQRIGKLLAKRDILKGQIMQSNPLANANLGSGNLRIKGVSPVQLKDKKGNNKANKTAEQQLKELRAIDRSINNEITKLIRLSNGKLTEQNIIAMSQLQQFQDMFDIAQSQIAPGILSTVQQAYNNVVATHGAGSAAGTAAGNAGSAAANAAIIAQFLAQQAVDKAGETTYKNDGTLLGLLPQNIWEKVVKNDPTGGLLTGSQRAAWAKNTYIAGDMLQHPGLRPEQYSARADDAWKDVQGQMAKNGTGFKAALGTMSDGIKKYAEGAALAAYMNSDVGEGGSRSNPSGSGGGGGGSGGSGSGDSDSGNKKNRVDLVLCNKKEIPKLNVNLFKKEPNFTILNKNFKLRDIKINTQDTPKSILSAVKNGIIDTAKRMDPKIIQDGESVYDPVGATEGKDTPSGTTPTSSS